VFAVLFHESDGLGVGDSGGDELFFLPYDGEVTDWPKELVLKDGEFPDYLASDLGCRTCSEKMRAVLDERAGPADVLQWLPVVVASGTVQRPYYILHFPKPPDVLDRARTLWSGDFVVRPAFRRAALGDHSVFAYPGAEGIPLFVDKDCRYALERAGCTGLEFSQARVV